MNTPRGLILSEEPAHMMQWRRPITTAGVAVVGKTTDNRYEIITQPKVIGRYRLRFEVDVADHHDVVECPLPCKGDAYDFDGKITLDWRVTDPIAIVERRIGDGLELCCARLLEQLPQISRSFDIEQCGLAQMEINRILGSAPTVLPEGITVHRFAARLSLDDTTKKALQELRAAQRSNTLATVTQGGLDIEQERGLRRQQQRMEAIQAAVHGNYDLVAIHLSQHPEDTGSLINMIRSDYQTNEERRDRLIGELLKRDLIQDIDVGDLNSALLGNAATTFRNGPPRAIGLSGVVRREPTPGLPNGATPSLAVAPLSVAPHPATSPPSAPAHAAPVPAADAPDGGQQESGSGVVGWRRLPPRSSGSDT
ncbi:MAG: hypothetical protein ACRDTG_26935 [Pseudonocardiaceae bacterium]